MMRGREGKGGKEASIWRKNGFNAVAAASNNDNGAVLIGGKSSASQLRNLVYDLLRKRSQDGIGNGIAKLDRRLGTGWWWQLDETSYDSNLIRAEAEAGSCRDDREGVRAGSVGAGYAEAQREDTIFNSLQPLVGRAEFGFELRQFTPLRAHLREVGETDASGDSHRHENRAEENLHHLTCANDPRERLNQGPESSRV